MDSTPKSDLQQAALDLKKPIIVHDLQHICKQKVLINRITKEFLTTQIQLCHKTAILQTVTIKNVREKIKFVDQLTELYEQQCTQFDDIRQELCSDIYTRLNDLNERPDDVTKMLIELDELDNKLRDLSHKIDYFENLIPKEAVGTQYEIKKKVQLDETCATAALV